VSVTFNTVQTAITWHDGRRPFWLSDVRRQLPSLVCLLTYGKCLAHRVECRHRKIPANTRVGHGPEPLSEVGRPLLAVLSPNAGISKLKPSIGLLMFVSRFEDANC
jgi:hypothetical protein